MCALPEGKWALACVCPLHRTSTALPLSVFTALLHPVHAHWATPVLVVDLPQGEEFHFKLAQLALDMEISSPSVQKSNKVHVFIWCILYSLHTGQSGVVAYLTVHCYYTYYNIRMSIVEWFDNDSLLCKGNWRSELLSYLLEFTNHLYLILYQLWKIYGWNIDCL